MKFENTEVWGFEHEIRGRMRNPKESWNKSDSEWETHIDYNKDEVYTKFAIGKNDLRLAQSLIKAGSEHRKFLRQIFVSIDITAPLYWWKEFDTYKWGQLPILLPQCISWLQLQLLWIVLRWMILIIMLQLPIIILTKIA